MTDLNNPYAAPRAEITPQESQEPEPPRFFALNGRIGRCRFLVYSTLGTAALGLAMGMVLPMFTMFSPLPNEELLEYAAGFVAFLPMLIMARRRLHDLNRRGWWLLLLLLGLFTTTAAVVVTLFMILFLLLSPGRNSTNRFGTAPLPNSLSLILVAVPLSLAVIGWGIADMQHSLDAQRTGHTTGTVR